MKTAEVPTAWGLSFGYDIWANFLNQTVTKGSAPMLSVAASTKNQIVGFCYDAAGNLTRQGSCGSADYTYDAENRISTTAGVTYTYDGDGKRVKKSTGKLYWTGIGSDALTETDAVGNVTADYVFFGGKRIARLDSPSGAVHYYFSDHLGSHSVITNATGTTIEQESDFYPFGGERVITSGPNSYKFTGKERDGESNLDHFGARYYINNLGRFLTPDPLMASAHVGDPQSWNRYGYALNNPLRFVDPNGMASGCGSGDDSKCKVTIRVNVIYDKNVNGGKGLSDQQKKDFQDKTLGKAIKDLGKSGIGAQVAYSSGSLTVQDGKATVTGFQSNSLNLVVTNSLPTGNPGESPPVKNDAYVSAIGVEDAHNANVFPFFTNTVEHEVTHQLKGDTESPNTNPFSYIVNEFNVDFRVQMMGFGVKQDTLVSGAQNKPFTVPQKQENIKPKTDQ